MLLRRARPSYLKALVASLVVLVSMALIVHAGIPSSPLWVWLGIGVVIAFVTAQKIDAMAQTEFAVAEEEQDFD